MLGLFSALWGLSLLRWWTVLGSYDLAYFEQASWLLRRGQEPFVTIRGIHLLGDHGSFVFYPMAFSTGWFGIPGLLGLQSLLLAAGVVPLWLLARHVVGLSVGVVLALCGAYALYPALSNVALYDFHPEAVVVPALLTAAYVGLRAGPLNVPLYAVCIAAVLGSREDVAVPVAFLGLLLVVEGRRRLGWSTFGVAVAWLLVDVTFVLPHFAGGEYVQTNRFGQYGDSLGSALRYMAVHPFEVLGDAATKPNLRVVVGLFGPVLFLPFVRWRCLKYLLPGLPLQAAYLLSNVEAAHTITAQYTVSTIPFVFVATAFALRGGGPGWRWAARALPAAALICFLALGTASPRHRPWEWARRDAVDRARVRAADLVPGGAAVSTTTRMMPLLADRRDLLPFPMPLEPFVAFSDDAKTAAQREAETRWVVLDTADADQWNDLLQQHRERFLGPDNPYGFRVVFDDHGIVVYAR